MATFSTTINNFGTTTYNASPDVTIPFAPKSIIVVNEDSADDAFVSFDGVDDAAHLVPGTPDAGVRFTQRSSKVWVRVPAGSDPVNVQIIAEQ